MPVSLIPVANIDQIWPHLREGFHEAVMATGGDLSTGDLWAACRSGNAFLIVAHTDALQGASVWRKDVWQTGQKLRCLGLYGTNMADWIDDMKAMAASIAKDCGATALIAEGRPGWERIFKNARKIRVLYEETL